VEYTTLQRLTKGISRVPEHSEKCKLKTDHISSKCGRACRGLSANQCSKFVKLSVNYTQLSIIFAVNFLHLTPVFSLLWT
ncbi:unnamed protein product, partial [Hymenolepis diminuta]